ncbi:hypothetical protein BV25DRAFT_1889604 [Artomyces pyxidatus]|uniref:Uncharacterized protein n=1 Tax=Artomyces pyxidatus TaxID=48021 RepID=A0ACB8SU26_9AGAM|nr:hypothetical protein BV25DRAFT_1889604 [Artomyces pyxidatus]
MAPFSVASQVHFVSSPDGNTKVYRANADPSWTIGAVPHGGYVLSLIIEACLHYQEGSSSPDPIHVTAHYLRATSVGPLEVRVRTIRTGKTLSNISAELVQEGAVNVTAHIVCGVLDPASLPPPEVPLTLVPPAPHARHTPFHTHPSSAPLAPLLPRITFRPYLLRAEDHSIGERHAQRAEGGVDVGEWYTFSDPAERVTTTSLALFADLFPNLLPPIVNGGTLPPSWFPTVVLTLEFKAPIPRGEGYSTRTVGSFVTCRFVNDPQGRHDVYGELWTAPGDVADGKAENGEWRTNQRCLLVSHQMAMVLPFAVNEKKRKSAVDSELSKL